ncbi:MAG: M48 family metallopeptidase [Lachnospiraceae bacterium]|nr:M48 family metallopeptidase [Lachnospiraceae bacterium]
MIIRLAVIGALTLVFLYELFLNRLRLSSAKNPIPDCVADVYDAESYARRQAYSAEKCRLNYGQLAVSFLADLLLFLFNAYAAFAGLFAEDDWHQMFAVVLLNTLASLITLPFAYRDTMVIEEKYGFNRTTKKTFAVDTVKQFILQLGLITGIGSALMGLHRQFGDWLILVFAGVMMAFILFFTFLYPFFSKIFNKFTPLPDGELRERLTALLEKNGYKVRAINVMDASRRSSKSNAYFAGFGKMKTIVLYDTLLEKMTDDEICAVFAHELGHGLHKDTLRNQFLTFIQMLIIGLLAWLTLRTPAIFEVFGFDRINYGFALILIMSVEFALFMPLFGLVTNAFSRRAEYRADAHAAKEGCGEALISGLKKLTRENFSDVAPSPLLVALTYSHPTTAQRIEALRKNAE